MGGIMFDNILVSTDVEKAKAFADESWRKRNTIEKAQEPKSKGSSNSWWEMLSEHVLTMGTTAIVILVTTFLCCCLRSGAPPGPPANAPAESRTRESEGTSEEVTAKMSKRRKRTMRHQPRKKPHPMTSRQWRVVLVTLVVTIREPGINQFTASFVRITLFSKEYQF